MTIASTIAPAATDKTYAAVMDPAVMAGVKQAFVVAQHSRIDEISVAGSLLAGTMRALIWSDVNGAPSQVAHSRVGITPGVTGDVYSLDLSAEPITLPPGTYYLSVMGDTAEFLWFGEKGGGYPSAAQRSFSITDTVVAASSALRAPRSGWHGWGHGQIGTPGSEWNQSVAHLPEDPESANIIANLADNFGGGGTFMQIGMGKKKLNNEDFVAHMGECNNLTPKLEYMPRTQLLEALKAGTSTLSEDEFIDGHGDRLLVKFATNGRLDGANGSLPVQNQPGTAPVNAGSDNHIYLVDEDTGELDEYYKVYNYGGGTPGFGAGEFSCGVVRRFDLTAEIASYPGDDCCTSANARGGAYLPFLFGPDDIKANPGAALPHQLAFTMNNSLIRSDEFWGPGTHNPHRSPGHDGTILGNPAHALPYGAQLRLDPAFVINPAWPGALRSILATLKIYGMTMVDGSNPGQLIALNDKLDNVGWHDTDVDMNPNDLVTLAGVRWTDFAVVTPTRKASMNNCTCSRATASPEFETWR